MKRFFLTSTVLALVAVFGLSASVDAAPHHALVHVAPAHVVSHGHVAPAHVVHPAQVHPVRIAHYHVRGFRDWNWRCWFPGYRTYGYYSAADQLWYYWYPPYNQYLPISYMTTYPPTPVAAPMGMLPTALPPGVAVPASAPFVPGPITAP